MPLPDFYKPRHPPFNHQREALEFGWRKKGYGYLFEMGLGKTKALIDNFCLLHEYGEADGLLIIAPKSVYTNWTKEGGELETHLWDAHAATANILAYDAKSARRVRKGGEGQTILDRQSPGVRILAVNIEAVRKVEGEAYMLCEAFLRAFNCMMVVDESTIIKTHDSQQTKRILRLGDRAKYRRILTGSPSTGKPVDLYPQFEFLERGALGHRSWWTFREEYCTLREFTANGRTIKTITGAKNLPKLSMILKRYSYRCRKDECLDLPPKVYMRREIELTPEQKQAYKELKQSAMYEHEGNTLTTQLVVTQLMRLHQIICGHVKWDGGDVQHLPNHRVTALAEVLEESDEQTVIWCNYQEDVQIVKQYLVKEYGRDQVVEWHGGIPQDYRDAGEKRFQSGEARFMLATQKSGARGRTWTNGRLVIYYSNSYDLELREQSEDRCHRVGQTGTVTYVDIVVPNTVDDKIIKALRAKRNIVQELLQDGLRPWI